MSQRILEYCFGCTDPIFEGETVEWRIPNANSGYEEPYHPECTPYTFMVEEEEVYRHEQ